MADIEGKDPLQSKVEVPFTVIAVIVAGVIGWKYIDHLSKLPKK